MNQDKPNLLTRFFAAIFLAALFALSACATGPKLVDHTFSFDGWADKWASQVDLLEYSYGDQYHMVRDKVRPNQERLGYSAGVNGSMPVGDFFYVKWRLKETGEIVEDNVNLRNRLAANMTGHKITFVIDGGQLYIYLITPQVKTKGNQDLRTYLSHSYVSHEIYPANTYKP